MFSHPDRLRVHRGDYRGCHPDRPAQGSPSGLTHAEQCAGRRRGIGFTYFGSKDVVRHPLVQRIVEAYDSREDRATPLDRTRR